MKNISLNSVFPVDFPKCLNVMPFLCTSSYHTLDIYTLNVHTPNTHKHLFVNKMIVINLACVLFFLYPNLVKLLLFIRSHTIFIHRAFFYYLFIFFLFKMDLRVFQFARKSKVKRNLKPEIKQVMVRCSEWWNEE